MLSNDYLLCDTGVGAGAQNIQFHIHRCFRVGGYYESTSTGCQTLFEGQMESIGCHYRNAVYFGYNFGGNGVNTYTNKSNNNSCDACHENRQSFETSKNGKRNQTIARHCYAGTSSGRKPRTLILSSLLYILCVGNRTFWKIRSIFLTLILVINYLWLILR